ncbi:MULTISPECIES: DNA polymerase III subunit gamma/tau [Sphingomonas]|jgi:DNA polymerase-3 subunit gamma/tau|uniref:DNA polymerase III subunit gamma/tau n=1 Tax=Sphingomonas hankookensis TaxID=563996 RepID=A0ABR5YFF7_9SPHN|nr:MULTISPECIES: DNA polymerase III subunit gamma/tau [Sphingomonas]KZE17258.1 DNA polymerase III subunit gamma/tau [Sphingomonas hankookensis]PZT96473.1 MAG: DNA polymerase III subunit gamma/tau [Sphingomonas sp.]RSV31692.1 DNA polymerase III subunit gamma/tau [Sphingomonas sp. ABOLH]WCP71110.1 DNA polymerase III subunit gamma/tau [Sphingomonas hankookensis]
MSDSFLALDIPEQPAAAQPYRVLARKYRPQTFSQLIGQDAMVTTLGNAIKRGRLAHAFLLTGVRGVGKTSTARLIAKALNCIGPDGQGGPTIDPCGVCEPCRAIAEGRHIDVVEIDAASNNGVDSVREMTEAVRYAAVSARFKIYIIDEVHMMSTPAFNALLKTLEEPPAHVKFLLATTEVHKVPVTVLSRCQRFDLRRIPADLLAGHFAHVVEAEGVEAEPEALQLIARAAEGSARDGLSILDQAIAHGGLDGEGVRADAVRQMLGLSDRGAIRTLFDLLLKADGPGALRALRAQYDLGVDPASVLRTLLETVHAVTIVKVGGDRGPGQSAEERAAFDGWSALSFPMLHRLWQLLLKGHEEVSRAALPIEACEMALLRIVHASSLPDPGTLAKQLAAGQVPAMGAPPAPAPAPAAEPVAVADPVPETAEQVAQLLSKHGRHSLEAQFRNCARLIRLEPQLIELSGARPLPADFTRDLENALKGITGSHWRVLIGEGTGEPTLREQETAKAESERDQVLNSPLVQAALAAFPDATLDHWQRSDGSIAR